MAVSEVHACCPLKYVYGLLDLSVDLERKMLKPSQLKLTEYQTMHHMPISVVHACCPPKYLYGLLDLSVDHESRGGKEC